MRDRIAASEAVRPWPRRVNPTARLERRALAPRTIAFLFSPELERFSVRARELLVRDGWTVDKDGPAPGGVAFLGSFIRPSAPDFVATVEFILESGPKVYGFPGHDRFRAVIGGEFGVRHLPTAERLRALGVRCETNISIDIEDLFEEKGLALHAIEDERSADEAASKLADASTRYGEAFARDHSRLDAMITFVQDGRQTTRDEMFEAIFVPVAMSAGGWDAGAREATIVTGRR